MNKLHSFLKTQILAAQHFQEPLDKPAITWLKSGGAAQGKEWLTERKFPKAVLKSYDEGMKALIAKKDFEDDIDPHLQEVQEAVKDRLPKLQKDTTIPMADIKSLKDVSLVIRTESDAAWARLESDIGRFKDADLNRLLAPKVESSAAYVKAVKAKYKALTGKEGMDLDPKDAAELREKKPEKYKAYLAARREYTNVSKKAHQAHVRASGSHLMDVAKARKHLESKGYRSGIPEGFEGKLDENGRLHTIHGEPILGAPGSGKVKMNPNYTKGSSEYVFTGRPGFGEQDQYYYTAGAKAGAIQKKAAKVDELSGKIGDLRKKWGEGLRSKDASTRITAAILEACYHTSARIGNLSNKNDGMTTLKGKNIKVNGDTITFSYQGKSGQQQKHVMRGDDPISKKAIEIIKSLKADSKPDDLLFRDKNRRIGSRQVNDYFTSLGAPTTVHKMRHVRGNAIMKEALKGKPKTDDEKKITEFLTSALTKVGEQLGHFNKGEVTFATALQSYVSASLVENYYKSYNIRPPTRIQKVIDQAKAEEGLPVKNPQEVEHHGDVEAVKEVKAPKVPVKKAPVKPAPTPKLEEPAPSLRLLPTKAPAWFEKMSGKEQRKYIKENPGTKLKPTKLLGS